MTYPVFTNGTVLPASDLNAIGLWLVKSQTVGSGVSSVTVTGAFSADYDNYRIVVSGVDCSASNQHLKIQVGGVTSSYYWAGAYSSVLGAGAAFFNGVTSGDSYVPIAYTATQNDSVASVDVLNPFAAQVTKIIVPPTMGDSFVLWVGGAQTNASSYSSFTILPNSGTMTGGTISVYGYRK